MKLFLNFYKKTSHTKRIVTDLVKNLKSEIDEIVDLKNRNGIWGWINSNFKEEKNIKKS